MVRVSIKNQNDKYLEMDEVYDHPEERNIYRTSILTCNLENKAQG
jgi:hypothetical protein